MSVLIAPAISDPLSPFPAPPSQGAPGARRRRIMSEAPSTPTPARSRPRLSEDWAATLTGLVLLGLCLLGAIPAGLIP